ncbi:MAG: hypothetical protein UZ21_OP11001001011 [Microgenomates bacterium OLB22]|nr:MAG: hypothetical protein UZ21_OP11001001011 [Microgenomates bacterium OLB22]
MRGYRIRTQLSTIKRTYYINIHTRCRWMMEYPFEIPNPESPVVILHPEDLTSTLIIHNISGGLEIVTYGRWEERNEEFAKYMTQVD